MCGVESKWFHHISPTKYILPFFQQNYCTPPKCGELSEYTDSVHTEVEEPSSRCMNASDQYDRCGHDTRQFYRSCTACRRTANLPGPATTLFQSHCQVERIYWLIQCLKSVYGTPTLAWGNSSADLAAESAFSLPLIPVWLGTQQKIMSLLSTFKKDTLSYHHLNQGMFLLHSL